MSPKPMVLIAGVSMEQDSTRKLRSAELLIRTKRQLAAHMAHLRRLQAVNRRTVMLIERATVAYEESRKLLEQIDGAPFSPVIRSQIHIPE
jgi:hypothetical protein